MEWRILSDERTNTVLGGFSGLGGLWTSLGGLFTFVFGGTLLHYLGSKYIKFPYYLSRCRLLTTNSRIEEYFYFWCSPHSQPRRATGGHSEEISKNKERDE